MKASQSMTFRLGILFLGIALLPVIITAVFSNVLFTRTIQAERAEALMATADATRDRIEDYVYSKITDARAVSLLPVWKSLLERDERLVIPPTVIQSLLEGYASDKDYYDILLIDIHGYIRYSVRKEADLGLNIYGPELGDSELTRIVELSYTLLQTEISNFDYYHPSGDLAAFFASPIFDNGEIIGAVALQIDRTALNRIVNRYQGLGESGDILAGTFIDNEIVITTASRHSTNLYGQRFSKSRFPLLSRAAVGGMGGALGTNYQGNHVLAEWRYLPSLNWGLVVTIETDELAAVTDYFQLLITWILVIAVGMAVLGTYLSYKNISGPIVQFTSDVRRMQQGNLPAYIPVKGQFEVVELGRSFNALLNRVRNYQRDLELKVTERTHDLQQALVRAEDANRAKGTFLATMSHEIRTPLNGVIGFTELLKDTPLNSVQKGYVENAQVSAKVLLQLLNDILDVSKIEAGGLTLDVQACSLERILMDAVDVVRYKAETKGLELILELPVEVPETLLADEVRLKQIFVNLLNNAVKFTESGYVKVRASAEKIRDQRYRFVFGVKDSGIGISQEVQQLLFTAFTQADSTTTRKYGGTGLGLTISKLLIEKMGGYISIQSNPGDGAEFTFSIEADTPVPTQIPSQGYDFGNVMLYCEQDETRKVLGNLLGTYARKVLDTNASKINSDFPFHDFQLIITDFQKQDILSVMPQNYSGRVVLLYHARESERAYELATRYHNVVPLRKPVTLPQLRSALEKSTEPNAEVATLKDDSTTVKTYANVPLAVLIVEDTPLNMMLIRTVIKKLIPKSIILEAHNGIEAVDLFKSNHVDFVLMDINMPEMDGLAATRAIRSFEATRNETNTGHVPIAALTAGVFTEDRHMAFESGMDAFLSKPVHVEQLIELLERWFP